MNSSSIKLMVPLIKNLKPMKLDGWMNITFTLLHKHFQIANILNLKNDENMQEIVKDRVGGKKLIIKENYNFHLFNYWNFRKLFVSLCFI